MHLFNQEGAEFSPCRRYRYALWRLWAPDQPKMMVVGLNPSTANESAPDPTIRSVTRLAKFNGFGGFYMMNCFAFVSTDPNQLIDFSNNEENDAWLDKVGIRCEEVVFAWGNFDIVRKLGRDKQMEDKFPKARCFGFNANGSPKHPLFLNSRTLTIPWK